MAAERFEVDEGGRRHAVEVDAARRVTVGDAPPFEVSAVGGGEYDVAGGERRRRVFVAGPAERREVFVDGRVYTLEVARAGQRRARAGSGHADSLAAPMPGTVIKVLVAAGQQVHRGDALLMLEAMKMELPIRAPHDGTVAAIHCREGELVQAGVRLLDLSADDAEGGIR